MISMRALTRNPALLLFVAMFTVLVACLVAFGSAYQGNESGTIIGIPGLWFFGLIILPPALYVLLVLVWKRFDRIAR